MVQARAVATPPVTVLMSVHNGEPFLREAVDSILAQTFGDFEFIIVDDGSTDGTGAILRSYTDPRIVILNNERCLTLPVSLNRGLWAARSPLVARADADDVYLPTRLAKQMRYMDSNPQVGVASSAFYATDEIGRVLAVHRVPCRDREIKLKLIWASPLAHPVTIYRRELVLAVGGYDEKFWVAQDYDLWARLSERTAFGNVSEPLVKFRSHARSSAQTRGAEGKALGDGVSERVMSRYLARELSAEEAGALRRLLCSYSPITDGSLPLALALLRELMSQARAREPKSAFAWLRRTASRSLMQQSAWLVRPDSADSWRLFRGAVSLWPLRIATVPVFVVLKALRGLRSVAALPCELLRMARHRRDRK